jgi:hypothetical protein
MKPETRFNIVAGLVIVLLFWFYWLFTTLMSFRPNKFTVAILSAPAVASRKVFDLDTALLQIVTGGFETDRKRLQTRVNALVKMKVMVRVKNGVGARVGARPSTYRYVGAVNLAVKPRKKRVWKAVTVARRMRRKP